MADDFDPQAFLEADIPTPSTNEPEPLHFTLEGVRVAVDGGFNAPELEEGQFITGNYVLGMDTTNGVTADGQTAMDGVQQIIQLQTAEGPTINLMADADGQVLYDVDGTWRENPTEEDFFDLLEGQIAWEPDADELRGENTYIDTIGASSGPLHCEFDVTPEMAAVAQRIVDVTSDGVEHLGPEHIGMLNGATTYLAEQAVAQEACGRPM